MLQHAARSLDRRGAAGLQEGAREEGRRLAVGRGQARGTSALANNADNERREWESASRRSAQDTLRIRRTRTLLARSKGGEEAHGAWDGARDAEFGSARTLEEADE